MSQTPDTVLLNRIDEIEREISQNLLELVNRHAGWVAGKLGLAHSTFSHEL